MLEVFRDPFMQTALAAGLVVGIICAYLSVYVVLRRIVFVGAALAQVSSAGVALALLIGWNPSLTSLIFTFGGVAAFSVQPRGKKITQESVIGIGYALASALAVLLVAKSAQGEAHLLDVLSGNILTVTPGQIWLMAGVGVVIVALHIAFQKQLLYSSFDPETAQAAGVNTVWWDLFFFLTLGAVIALAIRLAGMLFVFAFLVIPAVTALMLSQRLKIIYLVSVAAAVAATIIGLYISFKMDLPSGPTIVVLSFLFLLPAAVVSRVKK